MALALLTNSILDVGFVRHTKEIRNFDVKGDFIFDGINFKFDSDNPINYWQELESKFVNKVYVDENKKAYTSGRPLKVNAAIKYSFGPKRSRICDTKTQKKNYDHSIGIQLHSITRPMKPQFS